MHSVTGCCWGHIAKTIQPLGPPLRRWAPDGRALWDSPLWCPAHHTGPGTGLTEQSKLSKWQGHKWQNEPRGCPGWEFWGILHGSGITELSVSGLGFYSLGQHLLKISIFKQYSESPTQIICCKDTGSFFCLNTRSPSAVKTVKWTGGSSYLALKLGGY